MSAGWEFEAELWVWNARRADTWIFVSTPPGVAEQIRDEAAALPPTGFGSVRVTATIGGSTWATSVFPGSDDRYDLPIKKSVRQAEGLEAGDRARVRLELVQPG